MFAAYQYELPIPQRIIEMSLPSSRILQVMQTTSRSSIAWPRVECDSHDLHLSGPG